MYKEKVLFVPSVLEGWRDKLNTELFELIELELTPESIDMIKCGEIDAVVIDSEPFLLSNVGDGVRRFLTTLSTISQINLRIPIIAITPLADPEQIGIKSLSRGAYGFVIKEPNDAMDSPIVLNSLLTASLYDKFNSTSPGA